MSRRDRYYPRLIAWLRILLPLLALGLLSTLFLLSRNIDPSRTIPFVTDEMENRVIDQQVTGPFFSGATAEGDLISFIATTARPDPEQADRLLARDLTAHIDFLSGSAMDFSAKQGVVNDRRQEAELIGDAVITTSAGYRMTTEKLTTALDRIEAETAGPVTGTGPPGRIDAGKMQIDSDPETGNAHLLFTNGVKLIYDPAN
ncbi:lipopolysaccharide export system protein LptC [Lutimaribacter pacificus]|uniref:Lipopolysaccharide export system protein LptC n=1 Tax=Lutimaribacter pacificus TaxID=391948 RepID=A0A1H0E8C0_9RHOB|nr:LPS export ABC transporter periplasmic protein LptC [Lutimaribacter pacificus]SDN78644.1 lipopolysaccharide export system protein LptC [Lutimaribacter pacificus]SHK55368.1 lipopolysaccharide export system protein LptC [Lutimaribacter pacificus]